MSFINKEWTQWEWFKQNKQSGPKDWHHIWKFYFVGDYTWGKFDLWYKAVNTFWSHLLSLFEIFLFSNDKIFGFVSNFWIEKSQIFNVFSDSQTILCQWHISRHKWHQNSSVVEVGFAQLLCQMRDGSMSCAEAIKGNTQWVRSTSCPGGRDDCFIMTACWGEKMLINQWME